LDLQRQIKGFIYQPQVSSFVLATNAFGDFSKCTIISHGLLKKTELRNKIATKAAVVWREFVHQPQTGRCLVFLHVLKIMIQKMTDRYRKDLKKLESVLDLEVCTLLPYLHMWPTNERQVCLKEDAERWSEDREAVRRFQLGLWSLESLYKLQRALKPSIESIREAKEQLSTQIKDVSQRRTKERRNLGTFAYQERDPGLAASN